MIIKLLIWLLIKILKDGGIMMAMFFAQRVILGKTDYRDVPETLKPGVKEILVDSGLEYLAEEAAPTE
jgi:hypothetical protein